MFPRFCLRPMFVVAFMVSTPTVYAQSANNSATNATTKEFHALLDADWELALKTYTTFASALGDKRYNDRWDDVRLTTFREIDEHNRQTLSALKKLDRADLSVQEQLNFDLFKKKIETMVEQYQYKLFLAPITQLSGIQTADELADLLSFENVKDYEDWIARLKAFPQFTDQTIALLREGMANHIIWSRQALNRIPAQIDKQLVDAPEKSAFYAPFRSISTNVTPDEQARLQADAKQAITANILPSFQKLKKFFTDEYLPAAPPEAGIWQMPNGDKIYESLARMHTTTDLTPREIHEKGLAEVARIRVEMEKIKTQVGFSGSLKDFFQFLRTDKRFYYQSPEELLTGYRATAKRIDPELTKLFKTLPRTPYGVVPVPEKIAPDTTAAYYNAPSADGKRPGLYYVNLYKPESRPKWEMMALSLHESVPGHHLQLALQQELGGEVPNFRKYGGYTAFVEGWGLYAESLGDNVGLYSDPYDRFGYLTYEMWRAVRLVVDTGMHYYKWDRAKAIEYFRDNTAKTDLDIVNEIDRYISDPGQALAYKIGQLKFKELRTKAKAELGDKFDIRQFHDVVLLSGALPLDLVERNVNEWVARNK